MYTQCSRCETVFELSAEILRAAGGQVRCGNCGEVFNALARLAEDSNIFMTDEMSIELETRAESILESPVAQSAAARPAAGDEDEDEDSEEGRPGVEIARLEVIDWPEEEPPQAGDDRSLEFTLPPGDLDRIFIESKKPMRLEAPPLEAPPLEAPPETPPDLQCEAADSPSFRHRVTGFEVPEDVRRDMLEGFQQRIVHATIEPAAGAAGIDAPRRSLLWWLGAAVVSALLLTAQIVHQNREWLVAHAHGTAGAAVRALYRATGSALPEPANLSAYQLRQWGVTGDPEANGILRLRASILNAAPELQPWPVLRVTLADRFGRSIGRREFEPREYMGKPTPTMLAPGERADATLDILDPGKNAEGFEIDVCVRGADQRVSCANDVAPPVQR